MKPFTQWAALPFKLTLRSQAISYHFYVNGLGPLFASLGIEVGKRGLRYVGVADGKDVPLDGVLGKNLVRAFVKLGPLFIKLGQMLATRPDFVGEHVSEELKVLFDRVPPVTFKEIQSILNQEIGRAKIKHLIKYIEPKPLASASLSQTHRATLADGSPIILKVQKRGVADKVRMDLLILEAFIRPLNLVYPKLSLLQMFQDFREGSLREIDYREEAKNIERFQKNYHRFFSDSDVLFPRYFPELTTERVIALEPMHGKKLTDLKKGSTIARSAASKSLAAVLEQIFDHGFFHGDPHGGNLFFLEDEGQLGFIDLGLVGQLRTEDKQKFLKVLMAILKRDRARLAKALFEMGTPSRKTKFDNFEAEIQALLDEVKRQGIDSIRLDQMVNRLLVIARKNGIAIPNRYILMIRSCLIIEGVAKGLDPKLSVFDIAVPIVARSLLKTYNPLRFLKRS